MKCKDCAMELDCLRNEEANGKVLDIHKDRQCRFYEDRVFGVIHAEGPPPWEVDCED